MMQECVAFSEKNNIILVNDNPYGLLQDGDPLSLLGQSKTSSLCVELNSLSKSFNMAGWRVGMMCGNAEIIQNTLKVKSNVDSGMFKPVQLGAIQALSLGDEWFKPLRLEYAKRRALAEKLFKVLNCNFRSHQKGMFLWGKVPEKYKTGEALADILLDQAGVFITPGFIFGDAGNNFIRVSLCSKKEIFEEALSRIAKLS
jgi:aspartate/methionine/tyrosine aminotransferase